MRKKNSYSRIIQDLENWENLSKGKEIQLFHVCVEKGITSFLINYHSETALTPKIGTALSESGLSRDEIQLIAHLRPEISSQEQLASATKEILKILKTDYLDLLIISEENELEEMQPALDLLKSRGSIVEFGISMARALEEKDKVDPQNFQVIFRKQNISPAGLKLLNSESSSSAELLEILFLEKETTAEYPQEVQQMASKYNLLPNQFILAWILQHPRMFHTVVQGSKAENPELAHKALSTTIIEQDWKKFTEHL